MSTSTTNPNPAPTPAPAPPPAPLARLIAAARMMFIGLVWGGALLIILAWWLGLKFAADERSVVIPWIIGIAGGVSLILAGWHVVTLWVQKTPPERKASDLAAQRRVTAMALLAGGVLLLVVDLFLAFMPAPGGTAGWPALRANFAEAVGLFLFALIVLATGRALLYPPRDELATVNLEPLRGLLPLVRMVLYLLIAACGIALFFIWYSYKEESLSFMESVSAAVSGAGPEIAGLILFGLLCAGMQMWLGANPSPDAFHLRAAVLVFGGSTGLILFLATWGRVIFWRSQVLTGLAAWQGEDSWRLWLCVYLQLIALALMFGSLLLARADVRSSAVLRRVLFGYNTILNGLLVAALLIVANIAVGVVYPYTDSWTKTRGLHNLAQASKNLLHQLRQPTHIFVLMSERTASQLDVRTLLENMQAESGKVDVSYISPDSRRDRVEYDALAKKFPKILPSGKAALRMDQETGRGILIVYGEMPKNEKHTVPYAFIPERKIYEETGGFHGGEKPTKTFKGEVEVMKELNFLVHGAQNRKLYFLQGDDEIDITEAQAGARQGRMGIPMSPVGASALADRLRKDNYDVEAITFVKEFADKKKNDKIKYRGDVGPDHKPELPDPKDKDTYAVVIAGASRPFTSDALAAIERYLDRGGKLMVLLDVVMTADPKTKEPALARSGLSETLKRYGIASTDEMALSQFVPPGRQRIDPFEILVQTPADSDNMLARQFTGVPMVFETARVVRPATGGRFKAEPIYATLPTRPGERYPSTIAVRNAKEFLHPLDTFDSLAETGELVKRIDESLPLVVAVSEETTGKETKPRMVVFGDTEFISNLSMRTAGRADNYSLFVSALEWMSEHQGLMGPQPKTSSTVEMPAGKVQETNRIHLVPLWLMLLCIVGVGTGVWLVRRR